MSEETPVGVQCHYALMWRHRPAHPQLGPFEPWTDSGIRAPTPREARDRFSWPTEGPPIEIAINLTPTTDTGATSWQVGDVCDWTGGNAPGRVTVTHLDADGVPSLVQTSDGRTFAPQMLAGRLIRIGGRTGPGTNLGSPVVTVNRGGQTVRLNTEGLLQARLQGCPLCGGKLGEHHVTVLYGIDPGEPAWETRLSCDFDMAGIPTGAVLLTGEEAVAYRNLQQASIALEAAHKAFEEIRADHVGKMQAFCRVTAASGRAAKD